MRTLAFFDEQALENRRSCPIGSGLALRPRQRTTSRVEQYCSASRSTARGTEDVSINCPQRGVPKTGRRAFPGVFSLATDAGRQGSAFERARSVLGRPLYFDEVRYRSLLVPARARWAQRCHRSGDDCLAMASMANEPRAMPGARMTPADQSAG